MRSKLRPAPRKSAPTRAISALLAALLALLILAGTAEAAGSVSRLTITDPAGGNTVEEYDALVPHLARGRRVLVVDLPGSGYSDKPTGRYTLVAAEDALLAFLDSLDVRQVDVGGGSLGGTLSLRLAVRAPDLVDVVGARHVDARTYDVVEAPAGFA